MAIGAGGQSPIVAHILQTGVHVVSGGGLAVVVLADQVLPVQSLQQPLLRLGSALHGYVGGSALGGHTLQRSLQQIGKVLQLRLLRAHVLPQHGAQCALHGQVALLSGVV